MYVCAAPRGRLFWCNDYKFWKPKISTNTTVHMEILTFVTTICILTLLSLSLKHVFFFFFFLNNQLIRASFLTELHLTVDFITDHCNYVWSVEKSTDMRRQWANASDASGPLFDAGGWMTALTSGCSYT